MKQVLKKPCTSSARARVLPGRAARRILQIRHSPRLPKHLPPKKISIARRRRKDCRVEAIITKSGSVNELKSGEKGEVVLDRTVIYAESGGQVADTGMFYDHTGLLPLAEVTGAYYPVAGLVAHRVTAKETLQVGDRVTVVADAERRAHVIRNHSGTHLVHAALRNILGTHVKQAGSLNAPDRLRFDFSHFAPVGVEELRDIEQQVNEEIRLNTQIETGIMSLEEALSSGALAFFGDKYPESNVRVVTIPDPRAPRGFYSKELCGGTHVHRIGDIGVLKIVSEESVAAGVRRIEAVTGETALAHYQHQAHTLRELAVQAERARGRPAGQRGKTVAKRPNNWRRTWAPKNERVRWTNWIRSLPRPRPLRA